MEHLIELKDVYKIYHMGDEDVHALRSPAGSLKRISRLAIRWRA